MADTLQPAPPPAGAVAISQSPAPPPAGAVPIGAAAPKGIGDYAESFLTGLIPDTAKGLYNAVVSAFPHPDIDPDDAKHTKDLIDKGDYFGAAKHVVAKAVEGTPGGSIITGAIHNAIDEVSKATEAYKNDDKATAAAHLARAIPIIGPMSGGLVDTAIGTPEVRDAQHNVIQPATEGDPARALGQIAGLAVAPKVIEGSAKVAPAAAAVVKGAAQGAKEGALSTTEIPGHSYAARAAQAIGISKIPSVAAGAVLGKYGAHIILGPEFEGAGELIGAASPIVQKAWLRGKQALEDYNASQRVGTQNTPIWQNPTVPPSNVTGEAPPIQGPIPQPTLPSGRTTTPTPSTSEVRTPIWANGTPPPPETPTPEAIPQPAPVLPSGRVPGGIANQTPPIPPDPFEPTQAELEEKFPNFSELPIKVQTSLKATMRNGKIAKSKIVQPSSMDVLRTPETEALAEQTQQSPPKTLDQMMQEHLEGLRKAREAAAPPAAPEPQQTATPEPAAPAQPEPAPAENPNSGQEPVETTEAPAKQETTPKTEEPASVQNYGEGSPAKVHADSVAANAAVKDAKMAARFAGIPTSAIESMSDTDLINHLKAEGFRPPPKNAGTPQSSSRPLSQVRADIVKLLKQRRGETMPQAVADAIAKSNANK